MPLHILARRLYLSGNPMTVFSFTQKGRTTYMCEPSCKKEAQFQIPYAFTLVRTESQESPDSLTFPEFSWDCTLYNPCSQTRQPCSFPTIKRDSLEETTIRLKDADFFVENQSKGTGTSNKDSSESHWSQAVEEISPVYLPC